MPVARVVCRLADPRFRWSNVTVVEPVESKPGRRSRFVSEEAIPEHGRAAWLRLAALIIVLAAAGILATAVDLARVEALLQSVRGSGPAGSIVFVLLYAVCTLAPLPRNVLSTAAGTVFGFWWGLPLAYLGSLLGAVVAFWLARRLGQESVRKLGGLRASAFKQALAQRGLMTVLAARLAPVVPFTAFNYAAGMSDINGRTYWLGTLVGIVPGTAVYVSVGALALAPGSWSVEIAAAALLLLLLLLLGVAYVVGRCRGSRRSTGDRSSPAVVTSAN